jgi:dihydropyrimidine dehydrogenase (NAD+) subunit PreA
MGAAVGQVPEYCQQITQWVTDVAHIPIIVKLTPNITNVVLSGRAGLAGGAHALSLINTINSITAVDLDTFETAPSIGGKGSHGGYAGPAVKPIALNMLASLGTDEVIRNSARPISGMGGISTWRDAAEFLLLGASSLQVCTAVMHYGFRIIEDLCEGLSNWMDEKGFNTIGDLRGRSLHRISDFKNFDLSFRAVARINTDRCIKCNLCYVACNDTAHQCIDLIAADGARVEPRAWNIASSGKADAVSTRPQPHVREDDCVGCRLCYNVCPVEHCIEMVPVESGREPITWEQLTTAQPNLAEDWEAMKRYREEKGIHIH